MLAGGAALRRSGSGGSREGSRRSRSSPRSRSPPRSRPPAARRTNATASSSASASPGPWVVVPGARHGRVPALAARADAASSAGSTRRSTSRDVHVGFDGRLGAPVQPGVTTTRYALFRAVSTSSAARRRSSRCSAASRCRAGAAARRSPRASARRGRRSTYARGSSSSGRATCVRPDRCASGENLVDAWHAVAFRTKQPPPLAERAVSCSAQHVVVGKQVVVTASATDALSIDAHAIVQAGAECAP